MYATVCSASAWRRCFTLPPGNLAVPHERGMVGDLRSAFAWNNTGVHRNFACAAGPVQVPARFTAVPQSGAWRIYAVQPGFTTAVYATPTLGLLAVFRDLAPDEALRAILRDNPDPATLPHTFQFPNEPGLTDDLAAPPQRWVMVSHGDRALVRDFDCGHLLAGKFASCVEVTQSRRAALRRSRIGQRGADKACTLYGSHNEPAYRTASRGCDEAQPSETLASNRRATLCRRRQAKGVRLLSYLKRVDGEVLHGYGEPQQED